MNFVPIGDRKGIGELPILIYEVKLIPRQEYGRNQLYLQLGHPHSRTWMPTGSPTNKWIGSVRDGVRSQPTARIVLVGFGVVFRVQMDVTKRVREEIPPLNDLLVDLHFPPNVPSEHSATEDDPLGLPGAGIQDGQFVFPCGEGDGRELLVHRCGGG